MARDGCKDRGMTETELISPRIEGPFEAGVGRGATAASEIAEPLPESETGRRVIGYARAARLRRTSDSLPMRSSINRHASHT
jgi:hypothetical protein